jgi:hypothetical protein
MGAKPVAGQPENLVARLGHLYDRLQLPPAHAQNLPLGPKSVTNRMISGYRFQTAVRLFRCRLDFNRTSLSAGGPHLLELDNIGGPYFV